MKSKLLSTFLWIALAPTGAIAADSIVPGTYITEYGGGTFVVSPSTPSTPSKFRIVTWGSNAHNCSGEGEIRDNLAIGDDCVLKLEPQQNRIKIQLNDGTCGCGMNASVEGDFFLEDPYCADANVEKIRNEFSLQYKSSKYQPAKNTLNTLLGKCGRFMDWHLVAEIRNDLAITEFHLGDKAACLKALEPIREFVDDPAVTGFRITPVDEVWGGTMLKTTRFNWKKCGGKLPNYLQH